MAKNLLCIPLIGSQIPEDIAGQYWAEVEVHINRLERSFGEINKFYHETIYSGGESGLRSLERINERGYKLIKKRTERGAQLEALEDKEIFLQIADCQLFLTLRFASREILEKISKLSSEILEMYQRALQKREEHISRRISETLGDSETGALFASEEERVRLQFPSEVNVILVRPPVLNEIEKLQKGKQI